MKFKIFIILSIILTITSCAKTNKDTDLIIYSLRGPSGIAMIKLFEDVPVIEGFNVTVEALAQSDLMAARFISGEAKVGILPPNVAAKIFTTGAVDLRIAAVTGTGMLSLLSADSGINSILDLKDKTVYSTGQGTIVDLVFQRILRFYGLVPGVDVDINYSLAYPELAQSLAAERVSIGLLPEPFAAMAILNNNNLHSVCDIQNEWKNSLLNSKIIYDEKALVYPTTVFVVDGEFADTHPEAIKIILNNLESSINWVMANPKEAALLVEKHDLAIRANVAEIAIPKSNYTFITAMEARPSLEAVFSIFLENDPASIGGSLPADKFYLK